MERQKEGGAYAMLRRRRRTERKIAHLEKEPWVDIGHCIGTVTYETKESHGGGEGGEGRGEERER